MLQRINYAETLRGPQPGLTGVGVVPSRHLLPARTHWTYSPTCVPETF